MALIDFLSLIIIHTSSICIIQSKPHLRHLLDLVDTVLSVPLSLPSLFTPREMCHGNQEEAISSVRNTSQHIPPCDKRRYDSKATACLDESCVGRGDSSRGGSVHITSRQHEKGEPDGEEERGECESGAEGEKPEDESKDEPALFCCVSCAVRKEMSKEG